MQIFNKISKSKKWHSIKCTGKFSKDEFLNGDSHDGQHHGADPLQYYRGKVRDDHMDELVLYVVSKDFEDNSSSCNLVLPKIMAIEAINCWEIIIMDNFRAEANKQFDFNLVMVLVDSKVIIIIETTIVLLDFIEKLVANNEVDFSN